MTAEKLPVTMTTTLTMDGKYLRGLSVIGTVTKNGTRQGQTTNGTHFLSFSVSVPHVERAESGYQKPFYITITLYSKDIKGFRCVPGPHDTVLLSGLRTRSSIGKDGKPYVDCVGWGDRVDIIEKKGSSTGGYHASPGPVEFKPSPPPAAEKDVFSEDIPF
jgi:hypothetical protein